MAHQRAPLHRRLGHSVIREFVSHRSPDHSRLLLELLLGRQKTVTVLIGGVRGTCRGVVSSHQNQSFRLGRRYTDWFWTT